MSKNDDFPTEYDTVVLGTGMTESIVAAALARIGQKVLHLDRNDFYSGDWACFHLEALQRWIDAHKGKSEGELKIDTEVLPESLIKDGENLKPLSVQSNSITHVEDKVYIQLEPPKKEEAPPIESPDSIAKESSGVTEEKAEGDTVTSDDSGKGEQPAKPEAKEDLEPLKPERKQWAFSEIKSLWRRFNIDLIPKVLYCRGSMVELLISSDVAKYCEFKTISRVLTLVNGKLEQVPCSRSDVFNSKQVSMIEKRMMMKFLTFAIEYEKHPEEYEDDLDKPFVDFLKSKKLSANVQHYIKQAIAMANNETTTKQGLECTQKFLQSLGRYGNTAFLWPVYGAGELPQCFCRMCAVFGGIYCLRRTAQSFITNADNKCVGIIDTEGKRIETKWLVMDTSYASNDILQPPAVDSLVSRCLLITDRSLLGDSEDNITLLSLPSPDGRACNITLYELGSASYACPKGLFVIQMTCSGTSAGAAADFKPIVDQLFQNADSASDDNERPAILYSVYFSVRDSKSARLADDIADNVFMVDGPDDSLDFDHSIKQAREIFEKICPGEEFLPKAPNPEDIIWDDGEGNQPKESGFESKDGEGEKSGESKEQGDGENTEKGEQVVDSENVEEKKNNEVVTGSSHEAMEERESKDDNQSKEEAPDAKVES